MKSIGMLGLGTSHSNTFADVLEERDDAALVAVWDGDNIRGDDHIQEFTETYDVSVYADPTDMVDEVDGAMVLCANWDEHVPVAKPFLEAGVPTLLDKPLAGRLNDLATLETLIGDTPLVGGSAVAYHEKLQDIWASENADTVYCVGYNDPFYYGAHLVDIARTIAGSSWQSVKPTGEPGETVEVIFTNGTSASLRLDGPGPDTPDNQFLVVSSGDGVAFGIGSREGDYEQIYHDYIDNFLQTIQEGGSDSERLLDSARLLLAVNAAIEDDQIVTPKSEVLREYHADGAEFLQEYRKRWQ